MVKRPIAETLRVNTHEVIHGDGTRSRGLHVFCRTRAQSIDVATCEACPHLETYPASPGAPGACIVCWAPRRGAGDRAPNAAEDSFVDLAKSASVGEAMGPRVVCVGPEVGVEGLRDEFQITRAMLLPVVEPSGRLVGVLWRFDLAPSHLRELIALRHRREGAPVGTVAEQMDPHALAVQEGAPLTEALRAMTVDRARTVTVVAIDGTVVGLLSDLELLMWFARQRRGL